MKILHRQSIQKVMSIPTHCTYTGVGILRIHANPNIIRVFVFDVSVCGLSNSRRYDSYGGSDFSKDSAAAAVSHVREIAVYFLTGE